MGNFCSIYHAHFDKLVALTNNHNKAVFLDKCIFWWQFSKYTLGDEKIWFTRTIPEIAHELSISERSVSRYLNEMETLGFLERVNKLSASNKNNEFRVGKRLYIRVTDKLLTLLQRSASKQAQPVTQHTDSTERCFFSDQHGKIENANLAESIYKETNYKINNSTVSHTGIVNNLETETESNPEKRSSPSVVHYPIELQMGEQIDERLKNYIKGMIRNLEQQDDLKLSDPNKLFAEIVFSITQEVQWQGIGNRHHRVNIIAKLLRQHQWRTPKGFYNHWDLGHYFRQKETKRFEQAQQFKKQQTVRVEEASNLDSLSTKAAELRYEQRYRDEYRFSKERSYPNKKDEQTRQSALIEVNQTIRTQEKYLNELRVWLEQKRRGITQALLDSVALQIATLYQQKQELTELSGKKTLVA